jgi:hypothetical protein
MIGLKIVSVLFVNIFVIAVSNYALPTESAMASKGSEEDKSEINLANIQELKIHESRFLFLGNS